MVERVLKLGAGAELAKADVSKAYRNVPVHPEDRWLLGMEWNGQVFVDGVLLFGLRSAPLLFTALGDAVEWVAKRKGASWLQYYIDDFVMVGEAGTGECARSMEAFKEVCEVLGMPLDAKKEEGPAVTVGLEHDCVQDGLVVAAERVSQSRHRVVVEIRCPVERREHDEGRCGGRRTTSGAHNRRLRLLGLRSSVRTEVVPAGLGEGCSSQGVEHHAQRIAAHSSGSGIVGKAMEGPHCEGEMRQHGRGGDHKVWLVQRSTCHAPEEMPGISRGI